MEYTKGELSTGYNNLILDIAETYWKPNLDKFQLATILGLFLRRTAAPSLYEACKQALRTFEAHRIKPTDPRYILIEKALAKAEGK